MINKIYTTTKFVSLFILISLFFDPSCSKSEIKDSIQRSNKETKNINITQFNKSTVTSAENEVIIVGNNGTDSSNCGTSASNPCKNIQFAIENIAHSEGDLIKLLPGVYSSFLVTKPGLTIMGMGQEAKEVEIKCAPTVNPLRIGIATSKVISLRNLSIVDCSIGLLISPIQITTPTNNSSNNNNNKNNNKKSIMNTPTHYNNNNNVIFNNGYNSSININALQNLQYPQYVELLSKIERDHRHNYNGIEITETSEQTTVEISNCIFSNINGHAVDSYTFNLFISKSTFVNNTAPSFAAAVAYKNGASSFNTISVEDTTFKQNNVDGYFADERGGVGIAIYTTLLESLTISNCTFSNNVSFRNKSITSPRGNSVIFSLAQRIVVTNSRFVDSYISGLSPNYNTSILQLENPSNRLILRGSTFENINYGSGSIIIAIVPSKKITIDLCSFVNSRLWSVLQFEKCNDVLSSFSIEISGSKIMSNYIYANIINYQTCASLLTSIKVKWSSIVTYNNQFFATALAVTENNLLYSITSSNFSFNTLHSCALIHCSKCKLSSTTLSSNTFVKSTQTNLSTQAPVILYCAQAVISHSAFYSNKASMYIVDSIINDIEVYNMTNYHIGNSDVGIIVFERVTATNSNFSSLLSVTEAPMIVIPSDTKNTSFKSCSFSYNKNRGNSNGAAFALKPASVQSNGTVTTLFDDCLFSHNLCYHNGAAIEANHNATIQGCTFINNTAVSSFGFQKVVTINSEQYERSCRIQCNLEKLPANVKGTGASNAAPIQAIGAIATVCNTTVFLKENNITSPLNYVKPTNGILHTRAQYGIESGAQSFLVEAIDYCDHLLLQTDTGKNYTADRIFVVHFMQLNTTIKEQRFHSRTIRNGNGTYTIFVSGITELGMYSINVKINGKPLIGSPAIFSVVPGITISIWNIDVATGTDSEECGTALTPCKSIAFAATRSYIGDTYLIHEGDYYESNIQLKDLTNMNSVANSSVTIHCSYNSSALLTTSSPTRIAGIIFDGSKCNSSLSIPIIVLSQSSFVYNCTFRNFALLSELNTVISTAVQFGKYELLPSISYFIECQFYSNMVAQRNSYLFYGNQFVLFNSSTIRNNQAGTLINVFGVVADNTIFTNNSNSEALIAADQTKFATIIEMEYISLLPFINFFNNSAFTNNIGPIFTGSNTKVSIANTEIVRNSVSTSLLQFSNCILSFSNNTVSNNEIEYFEFIGSNAIITIGGNSQSQTSINSCKFFQNKLYNNAIIIANLGTNDVNEFTLINSEFYSNIKNLTYLLYIIESEQAIVTISDTIFRNGQNGAIAIEIFASKLLLNNLIFDNYTNTDIIPIITLKSTSTSENAVSISKIMQRNCKNAQLLNISLAGATVKMSDVMIVGNIFENNRFSKSPASWVAVIAVSGVRSSFVIESSIITMNTFNLLFGEASIIHITKDVSAIIQNTNFILNAISTSTGQSSLISKISLAKLLLTQTNFTSNSVTSAPVLAQFDITYDTNLIHVQTTIEHCSFKNNTATVGAVSQVCSAPSNFKFNTTSLIIRDTTFSNNTEEYGVIFLKTCNIEDYITIDGSSFQNNIATVQGGYLGAILASNKNLVAIIQDNSNTTDPYYSTCSTSIGCNHFLYKNTSNGNGISICINDSTFKSNSVSAAGGKLVATKPTTTNSVPTQSEQILCDDIDCYTAGNFPTYKFVSYGICNEPMKTGGSASLLNPRLHFGCINNCGGVLRGSCTEKLRCSCKPQYSGADCSVNSPNFPATNISSTQLTVVDMNNGNYSFEYSTQPVVSGKYHLFIFFTGKRLASSTFSIVANNIDATTSMVLLSTITEDIMYCVPFSFHIQVLLLDEYGNKLVQSNSTIAALFTRTTTNPALPATYLIQNSTSTVFYGDINMHYTIVKPIDEVITYEAGIYWKPSGQLEPSNLISNKNYTIDVTPSPVVATNSLLFPLGIDNAKVREKATFNSTPAVGKLHKLYLQLFNASTAITNCEPINCIQATLRSPKLVAPVSLVRCGKLPCLNCSAIKGITTTDFGWYEFEFVVNISTSYTIDISYQNQTLSGKECVVSNNSTQCTESLWVLPVKPGNANASQSNVVPLDSKYKAESPFVVTLLANDEYGNQCNCNLNTNKPVVELVNTINLVISRFEQYTCNDGIYKLYVNVTRPGIYSLSLFLDIPSEEPTQRRSRDYLLQQVPISIYCPAGTFVTNSTEDFCQVCEIGKYSTGASTSACFACGSQFTTLQPGAASKEDCFCNPSTYGTDSCFTCGGNFRNAGSKCTGGTTCKPQYTGFLCGACAEGYQKLIDYCVKCFDGYVYQSIVALSIFIGFSVLVVCWPTVSTFVLIARSVQLISILIFIRVSWPAQYLFIEAMFSISTANAQSLLLQCYGFKPGVIFIFQLLLPVLYELVIVPFVIVIVIKEKLTSMYTKHKTKNTADAISLLRFDEANTELPVSINKPDGEDNDEDGSEDFKSKLKRFTISLWHLFKTLGVQTFFQVNISSLSIFYVALCAYAAMPFSCVGASSDESTKYVMLTDNSIQCYTSEGDWLYYYAIPSAFAIIFYMLGIPILLYYLLKWKHPASKLIRYNFYPKVWWWPLYNKAEEILLVFVCVIIPNAALQIASLFLLCFGMIAARVVTFKKVKNFKAHHIALTAFPLWLILIGIAAIVLVFIEAKEQSLESSADYSRAANVIAQVLGFSVAIFELGALLLLVVEIRLKAHLAAKKAKASLRYTSSAPATGMALVLSENDVIKSWEINYDDLQIKNPPIAKGGNGIVNQAVYKGTIVAVKTLLLGLADEDDTISEFLREIKNYSTLHHPNIVLFIGACLNPMCIVAEFISRGSLSDVMKRHRNIVNKRLLQLKDSKLSKQSDTDDIQHIDLLEDSDQELLLQLEYMEDSSSVSSDGNMSPSSTSTGFLRNQRASNDYFNWERRLKIALGAARGMIYLHAQSPPILHRDLKSPNILVTSNWDAKLTDFGGSRVGSSTAMMTQVVGTTRWTAPEVLLREDYDEKVDVYSFGIVLWELLTGQLPFSDEQWETKVEDKIINGERPPIPELCPEAMKTLIESCWHQDASQRPTFAEVLPAISMMHPDDFIPVEAHFIFSMSDESKTPEFSITSKQTKTV